MSPLEQKELLREAEYYKFMGMDDLAYQLLSEVAETIEPNSLTKEKFNGSKKDRRQVRHRSRIDRHS